MLQQGLAPGAASSDVERADTQSKYKDLIRKVEEGIKHFFSREDADRPHASILFKSILGPAFLESATEVFGGVTTTLTAKALKALEQANAEELLAPEYTAALQALLAHDKMLSAPFRAPSGGDSPPQPPHWLPRYQYHQASQEKFVYLSRPHPHCQASITYSPEKPALYNLALSFSPLMVQRFMQVYPQLGCFGAPEQAPPQYSMNGVTYRLYSLNTLNLIALLSLLSNYVLLPQTCLGDVKRLLRFNELSQPIILNHFQDRLMFYSTHPIEGPVRLGFHYRFFGTDSAHRAAVTPYLNRILARMSNSLPLETIAELFTKPGVDIYFDGFKSSRALRDALITFAQSVGPEYINLHAVMPLVDNLYHSGPGSAPSQLC